jgi:hypothetical protein
MQRHGQKIGQLPAPTMAMVGLAVVCFSIVISAIGPRLSGAA